MHQLSYSDRRTSTPENLEIFPFPFLLSHFPFFFLSLSTNSSPLRILFLLSFFSFLFLLLSFSLSHFFLPIFSLRSLFPFLFVFLFSSTNTFSFLPFCFLSFSFFFSFSFPYFSSHFPTISFSLLPLLLISLFFWDFLLPS